MAAGIYFHWRVHCRDLVGSKNVVIPAGFLGINKGSVFCSWSFLIWRLNKADDFELPIYFLKDFSFDRLVKQRLFTNFRINYFRFFLLIEYSFWRNIYFIWHFLLPNIFASVLVEFGLNLFLVRIIIYFIFLRFYKWLTCRS